MSEITDILSNLADEHRLRKIPETPDTPMIDLSSNDYLGLGLRYAEFTDEFANRFPDVPFSSSASRLLSVQQKYHLMLEDYLASLYGRMALLFNSGYHANVGCIGALSLPSTLFVCDKLIHASVIDGLRISNARFKRFPHNNIPALTKIIMQEKEHYERIVIVVESIYSMDGDIAPLQDLAGLKRLYPEIMLYVDEAHAFGVVGERGLGVCESLGIIDDIDLLIGTFGKAAASAGAFAIAGEELKTLLINTARPFIFSTALPPVNVAWSLMMTEKITRMIEERLRLKKLSELFHKRISGISDSVPAVPSHIMPFITGNAESALLIADKLKDLGCLALPIRRPTVPPGGERIRFSLSAALSEQQLNYVADSLESIIIKIRG